MDVSRKIAAGIVRCLHEKKGMSIEDIAKAMSTTPTHIQEVINKKTTLQSENIDNYLQNNNLRFWEFAIEIIPMEYLSPETKKKIQICKEITAHIKKKKI